jgi:hypothetical protein
VTLRNIEPRDLELALRDVLTLGGIGQGYSANALAPDRVRDIERDDLRDLLRILTVLPADEVKDAALAAVRTALQAP